MYLKDSLVGLGSVKLVCPHLHSIGLMLKHRAEKTSTAPRLHYCSIGRPEVVIGSISKFYKQAMLPPTRKLLSMLPLVSNTVSWGKYSQNP